MKRVINVFGTNATMTDLSRADILEWVNTFLCVSPPYTRVEQLCTGAPYCQFLSAMYPGSLPLRRVKMNTNIEYESTQNFKLLQMGFEKVKIHRTIPIDRLVRGRFQDNLEFAQWFYKFFLANYNGQPYDAVAAREGRPIGCGPNMERDLKKAQKLKAAAAAKSARTSNYRYPMSARRAAEADKVSIQQRVEKTEKTEIEPAYLRSNPFIVGGGMTGSKLRVPKSYAIMKKSITEASFKKATPRSKISATTTAAPAAPAATAVTAVAALAPTPCAYFARSPRLSQKTSETPISSRCVSRDSSVSTYTEQRLKRGKTLMVGLDNTNKDKRMELLRKRFEAIRRNTIGKDDKGIQVGKQMIDSNGKYFMPDDEETPYLIPLKMNDFGLYRCENCGQRGVVELDDIADSDGISATSSYNVVPDTVFADDTFADNSEQLNGDGVSESYEFPN